MRQSSAGTQSKGGERSTPRDLGRDASWPDPDALRRVN